MSVLARRARDADDARYRALLALRDSVMSEIAKQAPPVGSLHIEEAVDTALSELLAQHVERRDLLVARSKWVDRAQWRLKDKQRSAAFRLRHPIPVDEHPLALSHDDDPDPFGVTTARLDAVQLQEIIAGLGGVQRQWADAVFALILAAPPADGSALPNVEELLGWSAEQTRKTAWRTHKTVAKFVADRASGTICSRRQALLDAYIAANEPGLAEHAPGDGARAELQAVALHLKGCEQCQLAWSTRRATLLKRGVLGILAPLDSLAALAHAASAWAQNAALALLGRLGIGGGGVAIGLSAKSAAVGVGVVCAACAATAELTGVLPPLRPHRSPELRRDAVTPARAPARAQPTSSAVRRTPTATSPTPTRRTATKRRARSSTTQTTRSSTRPTRTAVTPPQPPPPPPPHRRAAGLRREIFRRRRLRRHRLRHRPPPPAVAAQPTCTPGDLGC